jgi:hypothetical protein
MGELMNDQTNEKTIKQLLGPASEEIFCDECFEKIDEYVELELRGEAADTAIPGMRAHLEGCPACHDEYDSLRELVRREAPE